MQVYNINQYELYRQLQSSGGFTLAPSSEGVPTTQLWINSNTYIPYVYDKGEWQPLGAVYK